MKQVIKNIIIAIMIIASPIAAHAATIGSSATGDSNELIPTRIKSINTLKEFFSNWPRFKCNQTGVILNLTYAPGDGFIAYVDGKRFGKFEVDVRADHPTVALIGLPWLPGWGPAPMALFLNGQDSKCVLMPVQGRENLSYNSRGYLQYGQTDNTNWMELTLSSDGISFYPVDYKPSGETFWFQGVGFPVTISSVNKNGEIYVNGQWKGTGDWLGYLPSGHYKLVVKQDGYEDYTDNFSVNACKTSVKVPALTQVALVSINTSNEDALIIIDDKSYRTGKWSGKLPVGKHTLEVKLDKHEHFTQPFEVKASGDNSYLVSPLKGLGHLTIDLEEKVNAQFYVDGELRKINNSWEVDLAEGKHQIEVIKEGNYEAFRKEIDVKFDESQVLNVPKFKLVEYVDLGLPSGTLWAPANLGAEDEFDTGWEFGWGQITPVDQKVNYKKRWKKNKKIAKKIAKKNKSISGNPEYDAATAIKGNEWRIPTQEDIQELLKYCEFKCRTNEETGKKYIEVTGPKGKIIFPLSQYKYCPTELWSGNVDLQGYYKKNEGVVCLRLSFEEETKRANKYSPACHVMYDAPIRPVRSPIAATTQSE